jgi:hypothetical protein
VPPLPLGDSPIIPESVQHKQSVKRTAWALVGFLYLVSAGLLILGFGGLAGTYSAAPQYGTTQDALIFSWFCILGGSFLLSHFGPSDDYSVRAQKFQTDRVRQRRDRRVHRIFHDANGLRWE